MCSVIFLPYSYNYRNFILSGFIDTLPKDKKLTIYVEKNINIASALLLENNIEVISYDFSRNFIQKILYKILKERCFSLQNTETYKIKKKKLSIFQRLWSYPFSNSLFIYKTILHIYKYTLRNKSYKEALKEYKEFYFTMAHKPYEHIFYENAPNRAIKKNIVHSWDVITTKGSYLFDYDITYVWNKTNEEEYITHVKNIFGFKGSTQILFPWNFRKYYNSKFKSGNYVLYATSVERLVEDEIEIIKEVYNVCKELGIELKIRNHPQRENKIHITKNGCEEMKRSEYQSRDNAQFSEDFYKEIIEDVTQAFLIISVASTINLDAMCCGKHTAFISKLSGSKDYNYYYSYDHLASLVRKCNIPILKDTVELKKLILHYYDLKGVKCKKIQTYMPYE